MLFFLGVYCLKVGWELRADTWTLIYRDRVEGLIFFHKVFSGDSVVLVCGIWTNGCYMWFQERPSQRYRIGGTSLFQLPRLF